MQTLILVLWIRIHLDITSLVRDLFLEAILRLAVVSSRAHVPVATSRVRHGRFVGQHRQWERLVKWCEAVALYAQRYASKSTPEAEK